jgi:hypothetical protein
LPVNLLTMNQRNLEAGNALEFSPLFYEEAALGPGLAATRHPPHLLLRAQTMAPSLLQKAPSPAANFTIFGPYFGTYPYPARTDSTALDIVLRGGQCKDPRPERLVKQGRRAAGPNNKFEWFTDLALNPEEVRVYSSRASECFVPRTNSI